jgi:hypothetical protein
VLAIAQHSTCQELSWNKGGKKGNTCKKVVVVSTKNLPTLVSMLPPLQFWPVCVEHPCGSTHRWTQSEGHMFDSMFSIPSRVKEIARFKICSTSTWESANHSNSTYLCRVGTQSYSFRRESLTKLSNPLAPVHPTYQRCSLRCSFDDLCHGQNMVLILWSWSDTAQGPCRFSHICEVTAGYMRTFPTIFWPFLKALAAALLSQLQGPGKKSSTVKGAIGRIRCLPALTNLQLRDVSRLVKAWWKPDVAPSPFWSGI